jgi:hypothetical protein
MYGTGRPGGGPDLHVDCHSLGAGHRPLLRKLHGHLRRGVFIDAVAQHSAPTIAAELDSKITPADITAWSAGGPRDWAMQSFAIGKRDAYNLPSKPTCAAPGAITLSQSYQTTAEADAAHHSQLRVSGWRTS